MYLAVDTLLRFLALCMIRVLPRKIDSSTLKVKFNTHELFTETFLFSFDTNSFP
jgi:hypothetical protein